MTIKSRVVFGKLKLKIMGRKVRSFNLLLIMWIRVTELDLHNQDLGIYECLMFVTVKRPNGQGGDDGDICSVRMIDSLFYVALI